MTSMLILHSDEKEEPLSHSQPEKPHILGVEGQGENAILKTQWVSTRCGRLLGLKASEFSDGNTSLVPELRTQGVFKL